MLLIPKVSILSKQIFDIQGAHAPLRPRKTQRDKVLAAMKVGLYVPLTPPPPLLKEAVETCGW